MRERGIGLVVAARELHVTHPAVLAWITRRSVPRGAMRKRIATWTRNAVPADAWVGVDEAFNVVVKPYEPPAPESEPPPPDDDVKKNGTDQ